MDPFIRLFVQRNVDCFKHSAHLSYYKYPLWCLWRRFISTRLMTSLPFFFFLFPFDTYPWAAWRFFSPDPASAETKNQPVSGLVQKSNEEHVLTANKSPFMGSKVSKTTSGDEMSSPAPPKHYFSFHLLRMQFFICLECTTFSSGKSAEWSQQVFGKRNSTGESGGCPA